VRVGEDPWEGLEGNHIFSVELISTINNKGIFSLWDVKPLGMDRVGRSNGVLTSLLGLEGRIVEEWIRYIGILRSNFIKLRDEEDNNMVWSENERNGEYTTKIGYQAQVEQAFIGERIWWWEKVWKMHAPPKSKITLWLALHNQLLTWYKDIIWGWMDPTGALYVRRKKNQRIIFLFHALLHLRFWGQFVQFSKLMHVLYREA
jgi:hypothetical protein